MKILPALLAIVSVAIVTLLAVVVLVSFFPPSSTCDSVRADLAAGITVQADRDNIRCDGVGADLRLIPTEPSPLPR